MAGSSEQPKLKTEDGENVPSVDTWSEKNQKIVVKQPGHGFMYDLLLRSKLDYSPEEVYNVLAEPAPDKIFRGIDAVTYRRTLEDDGHGKRKLQVGHRAVSRFLWLKVNFETELYVWEDANKRTIRFTNVHQRGFMRCFEGVWEVHPFTQATLDVVYGPQGQAEAQEMMGAPQGLLAGTWGALRRVAGMRPAEEAACSLVTLEQAIAPRSMPPRPIVRVVRGMCARMLGNMMDDLRAELARRHAQEGATLQEEEQHAQQRQQQRAARQQRHAGPAAPAAAITLATSSCAVAGGSCRRGKHLAHGGSPPGGGGSPNPQTLLDLVALAVPLQCELTIRL